MFTHVTGKRIGLNACFDDDVSQISGKTVVIFKNLNLLLMSQSLLDFVSISVIAKSSNPGGTDCLGSHETSSDVATHGRTVTAWKSASFVRFGNKMAENSRKSRILLS